MKRFITIIKAWIYFVFNVNVGLFEKRYSICLKCEKSGKGFYDKIVSDNVVKILGIICDECNCPIKTKGRIVDEKCPLNKW